jgi:hypothetical protein
LLAVWAVVAVVNSHDLRVSNVGIGAEQSAAVFD